MQRTLISELKKHTGKSARVEGFVQAIRDQGSIVFMVIRDVTGTVQAVVTKDAKPFTQVKELSIESVVDVTGIVKDEKQAPGGFEIKVDNLEILSHADPELPIPVVTEKGAEEVDITKRLDWRQLDLRGSDGVQIFKTWTILEQAAREFWAENHFIQMYAPSFMSAPSESGAEVFRVEYFDRHAYLAQSPQYYKQAAMAAGFDRVFMVGPVFRAEPSFTTRHMTEFTGWDYEVSFIESHHDVMDIHEKFVLHMLGKLKKELLPELFVQDVQIPRVSMSDAKEKLAKAGVKSEKVGDVSPEEERALCEIIKDETGSEFVFLTDYPVDVRPFYHMRHEDDKEITKSFDLLYRGLEITTGAQREHRHDVLVAQAKEKGMDITNIQFYLNFFKYGCPPHGGIGFGPGRFVKQILGLESVKEATFLPRDVKRLTP